MLKSDFLIARDARQQFLDQKIRQVIGSADSIIFISCNIPGSDKYQPGVCRLLYSAISSLRENIDLNILSTQSDALGVFHIATSNASPKEAKMAAIKVENQSPCGRLADIDIYQQNGCQVDRTSLNSMSRSCLICEEPARECILLKRHSHEELTLHVRSLLKPYVSFPQHIYPNQLAKSLSTGALYELNLTPKPGLVDRYDSGSHIDLSYKKMHASIRLLPLLFEDIIDCYNKKYPMQNFVQAGIAAENRMMREVHSNAHKGFIFLSSILLMATCLCKGDFSRIRQTISNLARTFFANFGPTTSRSTTIKNCYGLGGIKVEIEQGLPSIFEYSWPKYREVLEAGWSHKRADFYLMALLMQRVEDTTAVHRCGLSGLERLRQDGNKLQRCLESRQNPEQMLINLNQDYRKLGLTMGGVADCMAITFALQKTIG